MNKTIQQLVEAICLIPRQFFSKASSGDTSGVFHERFVSQLIIKYRKLSGGFCRTESILPTSETIQKFACTPERNAMIRKLAIGIASANNPHPNLFMEQASNLSLLMAIVEVKTERKLQRGVFYWDLFKLHFLVEQDRCSCGVYFIINQDVESVQKKISAYYARGFYTSLRAENVFFLVKKDYSSDVVVLDYRGERFT